MKWVRCGFFAALPAVAWALSSPPAGAIVVGPTGKYSTLKAALADTSSSVRHGPVLHTSRVLFLITIKRQVYFIQSGTYTGQAVISRANLKIYGQTNVPGSYSGNSEYTCYLSSSDR